MTKIILSTFIFMLFLNADEYNISDTLYTCVAFEKQSDTVHERLDMRESLVKGGYFSFSVKINFLRAMVSFNKDTVNNMEHQDMRFAYRASVMNFDLYVYDYDKDAFLIEKGNKAKPKFSMRPENGNWLYYVCTMYSDTNNSNN